MVANTGLHTYSEGFTEDCLAIKNLNSNHIQMHKSTFYKGTCTGLR